VRTARPKGLLEAIDWADNGVGLSFSHSFGFGLMDAGAMVKLAKVWKTVPEPKSCSLSGSGPDEEIYPVEGGTEKSFTMKVSEDNACAKEIKFMEHLHVYVNLQSRTARGNLRVSLESPSGTVSNLLGFRPADGDRTGLKSFNKWPLMSVHYWGENPVGKWKLTITNKGREDAAFVGWTLKFYGTQTDPQPDKQLLQHRQVNSEGRLKPKQPDQDVSETSDEPEQGVSEARGLNALEAHIAAAKASLNLNDDVTEDATEESSDDTEGDATPVSEEIMSEKVTDEVSNVAVEETSTPEVQEVTTDGTIVATSQATVEKIPAKNVAEIMAANVEVTEEASNVPVEETSTPEVQEVTTDKTIVATSQATVEKIPAKNVTEIMAANVEVTEEASNVAVEETSAPAAPEVQEVTTDGTLVATSKATVEEIPAKNVTDIMAANEGVMDEAVENTESNVEESSNERTTDKSISTTVSLVEAAPTSN